MRKLISIAFVTIVLLAPIVSSEMIIIPDDFRTIQEGINRVDEGDTVLVLPGTYRENIEFGVTPFILASRRLLTDEDEFIERTIIEADTAGRSVIAIRENLGDGAIIDGFTIRNGNTDYGGGIYCRGSSPTLRRLIIEQNNAERSGGGIYCTRGASPTISHSIIQNNYAFIGGGGIACFSEAHATIDNTIISNNEVTEHGGGVHCTSDGGVTMENCEVTDNIAAMYGGGVNGNQGAILRLTRVLLTGNNGGIGGGLSSRAGVEELTLSEVVSMDNQSQGNGGGMMIEDCPGSVSDCIISGNNGVSFGGGMYLFSLDNQIELSNCLVTGNVGFIGGGIYSRSSICTLSNFTITGNAVEGEDAQGGGIVIQSDNLLTIENSIVWGNVGSELVFDGGETDTLFVDYCIVEGGIDSVVMDDGSYLGWNDGNLDSDPLFVDPDEDDYNLSVLSPCIDSGDPDYPFDPDGSRADMGMYYFHHISALYGVVTDAADSSALPDVIVETSDGRTATTDENGEWFIANAIPRPFDIWVTLEGYNPVSDTLELEAEDTLEVNFNLTHPGFELSLGGIEESLISGEDVQVEFTLTNSGNGELEWIARKVAANQLEAWELQDSVTPSEIVPIQDLNGETIVNGDYYLIGQDSSGANLCYSFDHDWTFIDTFSTAHLGGSITWDGELLWMTMDGDIAGYSLDGQLVDYIYGQLDGYGAITWDQDRELIWMFVPEFGLRGYDRVNNEEVIIPYESMVFGLAYWSDEPDGYQLYIVHGVMDSTQSVYKMNIDSGDTMLVVELDLEGQRRVGEGEIVVEPSSSNWVFLTSPYVRNEPDQIDLWQLAPHPGWMTLDPTEGVLEAEAVADLTLTLTTSLLDPDGYSGQIIFEHDALGGEAVIEVEMVVNPNDVGESVDDLTPIEFSISGIYPNPFNSSSTIRFSLPWTTEIQLRIFDLTGREVEMLASGRMDAGIHNIVYDASSLPSGLYLARLSSQELGTVTRRLVVMR